MRNFLLASALAIAPLAAAPAPLKVEITCNDQMTYNSRGFEAAAGGKIVLKLKNVGKIPAKQMAHNLVILQPGTSLPTFAGKAAAAEKDGYLPRDAESKKLVVAHTRRLGGGESDTITFTISQPGEYPFLCTTPGHFSQMSGMITVK